MTTLSVEQPPRSVDPVALEDRLRAAELTAAGRFMTVTTAGRFIVADDLFMAANAPRQKLIKGSCQDADTLDGLERRQR